MRVTTEVSDPYISVRPLYRGVGPKPIMSLVRGGWGDGESHGHPGGGLVRCRGDRFPPAPPPPHCPIDCTRSRVVLASVGVASTRTWKPSHRE